MKLNSFMVSNRAKLYRDLSPDNCHIYVAVQSSLWLHVLALMEKDRFSLLGLPTQPVLVGNKSPKSPAKSAVSVLSYSLNNPGLLMNYISSRTLTYFAASLLIFLLSKLFKAQDSLLWKYYEVKNKQWELQVVVTEVPIII